MNGRRGTAALAGVLALAGCATRADIMQQDHQLRGLIGEQRKQLQAVQREVERLRNEVEESGGRGRGGPGSEDRMSALERRMDQLEGGGTPPPGGPPVATGPVEAPPAPVASAPPPTTPPPPRGAAGAGDDEWRKEIAREQVAAGTVNVPERGEYLALLDGVAKQDCARVVPQLNSFAANHKESPLADNALYWAARCYQQKGRQEEAISKFYEVGTRYPKGDRAPAALWAQGNLFIAMGNSPDARIVLGKLIRDYPSSDEAARARQKLSDLEN